MRPEDELDRLQHDVLFPTVFNLGSRLKSLMSGRSSFCGYVLLLLPSSHRPDTRDLRTHRSAKDAVIARGKDAASMIHPLREHFQLRRVERGSAGNVVVGSGVVVGVIAEKPNLIVGVDVKAGVRELERAIRQ